MSAGSDTADPLGGRIFHGREGALELARLLEEDLPAAHRQAGASEETP